MLNTQNFHSFQQSQIETCLIKNLEILQDYAAVSYMCTVTDKTVL